MNRRTCLLAASFIVMLGVSCGSDDSDDSDDSTDYNGGSGSGGASMSATVAKGGSSASSKHQSSTPTAVSSGGTTSGAGGDGTSGNTQSLGTGGVSSTGTACRPQDMTGFSYPSYHAAKHVANACTDAQLETYYSDCYLGGNCNAFKSGGASATCGVCLLPVGLDNDQYGPLLKLGSDTAYLSATNLAGCIELVGEPDCAKKLQIQQLCEYYACESGCNAITDQASYEAIVQCMRDARSGVCKAAADAAVCITSSEHLAACSGSAQKTQFMTVATVFCQ